MKADHPENTKNMDVFPSLRDFRQMAERCIDGRTFQVAVLNAASNTKFERLDISEAKEYIGYSLKNSNLRSGVRNGR